MATAAELYRLLCKVRVAEIELEHAQWAARLAQFKIEDAQKRLEAARAEEAEARGSLSPS